MTTVYRIRRARRNGGDRPLYENREQFEVDLLNTMLAAENAKTRPWPMTHARRLLGVFCSHRQPENPITNFFAAEVLVDGEWIDMKPRLIEPQLVFDKDGETT